VAAAVELGGNNLTHVEVVAGLAVGDQIYLVRPPGAQLPGAAEERGSAPADEAVEAARADGSPMSDGPAGGG
jgi:hypothetical protein